MWTEYMPCERNEESGTLSLRIGLQCIIEGRAVTLIPTESIGILMQGLKPRHLLLEVRSRKPAPIIASTMPLVGQPHILVEPPDTDFVPVSKKRKLSDQSDGEEFEVDVTRAQRGAPRKVARSTTKQTEDFVEEEAGDESSVSSSSDSSSTSSGSTSSLDSSAPSVQPTRKTCALVSPDEPTTHKIVSAHARFSMIENLLPEVIVRVNEFVELPDRVRFASCSKLLQKLVIDECAPLWRELDFSKIKGRLLLTDERLSSLLVRVNARSVTKSLNLSGCKELRRTCLEPLRGSEALEEINLLRCDKLDWGIVFPILRSMVSFNLFRVIGFGDIRWHGSTLR